MEILRRALTAALAELGGLDSSAFEYAPPTPAPAVAEPVPALEEQVKIELPPDQPWLKADTETEILKENWAGQVREVLIGATTEAGGTRTSVVKAGGETAMPFMDFEAPQANPPVIAIEIKDRRPDDWSELLIKEWGDAVDDPAHGLRPLKRRAQICCS